MSGHGCGKGGRQLIHGTISAFPGEIVENKKPPSEQAVPIP